MRDITISSQKMELLDRSVWEPPAVDEGWGLVIDLDGEDAVAFGLRMAGHGYRPVPLFTCLPWAGDGYDGEALVPTQPLHNALVAGSARLADFGLPRHAPPVFLLDARRLWRTSDLPPDGRALLDNRSLALASEFPSVAELKAGGMVQGMIVIQRRRPRSLPQPDLHLICQGWLSEGLLVRLAHPDRPEMGRLLASNPPWYARLAQAFVCQKHRCLGGRRGVPPVPTFEFSRGQG